MEVHELGSNFLDSEAEQGRDFFVSLDGYIYFVYDFDYLQWAGLLRLNDILKILCEKMDIKTNSYVYCIKKY